jgi:beta-lactamase superfamily II metal-dependent hydrolase
MNHSADFFEIDFLSVEAKDSGDAIALRYRINAATSIHVVDGGFQDTGDHVVEHIRKYYGSSPIIDRVVGTHPDGDHLGGLPTVLENLTVRELWMLRPWTYAHEIIHRFKNVSSVDYLIRALKEAYPYVAALEEIANRKGIPIREPFQGAAIGPFRVLAPTRARYLDLIVNSDRTPDAKQGPAKSLLRSTFGAALTKAAKAVASLAKAAWGVEVFSSEDISAENKMSVIQYALLCNKRIVLTADAGLESFAEAAGYAPIASLTLPGVDRFQSPHHGSRRNVSTAMLDQWLGPRLPNKPAKGQELFTAVISSAKADADHPRKSVIRGLIHRGAKVIATEGRDISTHVNAPDRGWGAVEGEEYPEEQEE